MGEPAYGRDRLPGFGSPLLGREAELSVLAGAFEAANAGRPTLLLVQGEAGIGKTRLVREAVAGFAGEAVVVTGHCYEGSTIPYLPFAEAVRACLACSPDVAGDLSDREARLVSAVTGLDLRAQGGREAGPLPADDGGIVSLAISRLLISQAARRPLVLVIDDLHWVDKPSLNTLTQIAYSVADRSEAVQILVVCTYRRDDLPDEAAAAISRLQREPIAATLDLEGLAGSAVRELVRAMIGVRPSQELIDSLLEATGGNPLFLQEVLEDLRRRGSLSESGGTLNSTLPPGEMILPGGILSAVRQRLGGLGEEALDVLLVAACVGDPFDPEELIACVGDRAAVTRAMDEGVRNRFLISRDRMSGFAHPLFRHALLDTASSLRREEVNLRIAEALQGLYGDGHEGHIVRIAGHMLAAGSLGASAMTVKYARTAGERSFDMFAWGEAARFFAGAAERAAACGQSRGDVADLYYRAGLSAYRNNDAGPALDHLDRAIEGFRACGDTRGVVLAHTCRARTLITIAAAPIGTLVEVAPLEAAVEELGESEPATAAEALWVLGQCYWHAGRLDEAENVSGQALEATGARGDPPAACTRADGAGTCALLRVAAGGSGE